MINVYTLTYVYIYRKKEREGEENFRLNLESRFINANLSINRLDGQWFGVKQAAIKKGELKKRKRKKRWKEMEEGPCVAAQEDIHGNLVGISSRPPAECVHRF